MLVPQAAGIGIGASPDKIEFGEVSVKDGMARELHVVNTDNVSEQVHLTMENINLTIEPQDFNLGPRESRIVNISINETKSGKYNGNILIVVRPVGDESDGLGLGAGVRVPVSFVVKNESSTMIFLGVGGFLIAISILLWIKRLKT